MNTVDLVIQAIGSYMAQINSDPNNRLRSWEHCYKAFHDARAMNPQIRLFEPYACVLPCKLGNVSWFIVPAPEGLQRCTLRS